jgi:hypothetical protein
MGPYCTAKSDVRYGISAAKRIRQLLAFCIDTKNPRQDSHSSTPADEEIEVPVKAAPTERLLF